MCRIEAAAQSQRALKDLPWVPSTDTKTLVGWSAGLKVEQPLTRTRSFAIDYRHTEYEAAAFLDDARVTDLRAEAGRDAVRLQLVIRP